MVLRFIKRLIHNYKTIMDSSCIKCQKCNHYSYMMEGGGLAKIERCRKEHKEGKEDCPDYKEFVFSDYDSFVYYKGRIER